MFSNYGLYGFFLPSTTEVCEAVTVMLIDLSRCGLLDIYTELKNEADLLLGANTDMYARQCICRFPDGCSVGCNVCRSSLHPLRPMHKFVLIAMKLMTFV